MLKKPKNINLGRIQNGTIVGMDKKVTWDLDRVIAIFLRDSLLLLAKNSHSYPDPSKVSFTLNEDVAESSCTEFEDDDEKEDVKNYLKWIKHLSVIAGKFDYYLQDPDSFLSEEDQKALDEVYSHYKTLEEIGLNESGFTDEDKKIMAPINARADEIEENQKKILKEALDELKEIYFDLWD